MNRPALTAIMFDFDGVIADSEALANTVLAEAVTGLGLPTTLDDALHRYMGRRWPEVVSLIEADIGEPLPPDFSEVLKGRTLARFRTDLREIEGAVKFIHRFKAIPQCIASSSSADRLAVCLDVLGIAEEFAGRIFSADVVPRGKPHPDIFLHAAAELDVAPSACIVIEDSVSGVRAGVAAGMTVIGLCAGAHVRAGHAAHLLDAGARWVTASWDEVAKVITRPDGSLCAFR